MQARGGGELGDAPGQVAKGLTLPAKELGNGGHDPEKIKVPKQTPGKRRGTEFEQRKGAAGLQNAGNLSEALITVGKIPQAEGQSNRRKRVVRKG